MRRWLADKSPDAAEAAAEAILDGIDKLADFPLMGVRREPLELREIVIEFGRDGYVVRYRADGDWVFVTRIFHGRENR